MADAMYAPVVTRFVSDDVRLACLFRGQAAAGHALDGKCAMSSPEELTFVVGRWLRPLGLLLDMVRIARAITTSSREQARTEPGG